MVVTYLRYLFSDYNYCRVQHTIASRRTFLGVSTRRCANRWYSITAMYWNAARNYGINSFNRIRLRTIPKTKRHQTRIHHDWIYSSNFLFWGYGSTWGMV